MNWTKPFHLGIALALLAAPAAAQTAVAPECGTAPDLARGAVAGRLYGMRMNPDLDSPWARFIGYDRADIVPVTDAATCQRILAVLANARRDAAPDTLAIAGVLRLGDLGFVVYRSTPTQNGAQASSALLDGELHLLDYQQTSY